MALEDITSDAEEETKKEEVEEISDELGIEDKEDLEELSDRITRLYSLAESIDKSIEELEKDMRINRGAILALMKEIGNPEDAAVEQKSEDMDDNPWLAGEE